MTRCWSQLLTSVCTSVLYMSSEWSALWLPPTGVHAEPESEDHAEDIGHVFVHRPQEPIPNSWHITRQSYSKDRPADLLITGWFFFVCLFLKLLHLRSYFYFFQDLWAMINMAIFLGLVYMYFFYQHYFYVMIRIFDTNLFWHISRQQTIMTVGSFLFRRLEFTWATVLMKRQISLK